jgi:type IV pilus assembly protein PilE
MTQRALTEPSESRVSTTDMQRTTFQPTQRVATKTSGFSLIEMMVVVVVIAILTAIAIPIYERYVQESRRTAAKTGLMDVASREEKYFSTNNTYTANLTLLGYTGSGASITVPNNTPATDYYTITVAPSGSSSSDFTATAIPITGSTQQSDVCGNYTLTDLGVQGNSVTPNTGCW